MKMYLLAALAFVAVASAQKDAAAPPPIPILRSAQDTSFDGGFSYSFETGNSIVRDEVSQVQNAGSDQELRTVQGSYSYVDPDGNPVQVEYTVDAEGGFVARGNVLPQAPEVPAGILEALAKNAAEDAQLSAADLAEVETGKYIPRLHA